MKIFRNRRTLLMGGGLLLAATATAALAGSGIGGVFHLGQVNNVNGSTELKGSTDTQQLLVRNLSTSGGSAAILGLSVKGTGVWGRSNRLGVRGTASATTGTTYGVYATSASEDGFAGYFQNTSTTDNAQRGRGIRAIAAGASPALFNPEDGAAGGEFAGPNGVIGVAAHPAGAGVAGYAGTGQYGVFGSGRNGVYGVSTSVGGLFRNIGTAGSAVRGLADGATGSEDSAMWASATGEFYGAIGVKGYSNTPGGYGVLALQGSGSYAFQAVGESSVAGDLDVQGTLTKGGGSFKIDHPLDPANKYLSHSFVESPDMMNIYNGNVVTDASGVAVVELPDYFGTLNRDPRYQLTVIGSFAAAQIAQKVENNQFVIMTREPNVEVSWQVTGIRQDAYAEAHPIVVEEEKALADRGRYLHPVEHGQPATMAIGTHVAAQADADALSVR